MPPNVVGRGIVRRTQYGYEACCLECGECAPAFDPEDGAQLLMAHLRNAHGALIYYIEVH